MIPHIVTLVVCPIIIFGTTWDCYLATEKQEQHDHVIMLRVYTDHVVWALKWNAAASVKMCACVCVKCFCVHPWMFLCVHACFQAWRLCVCACVDACMHMCVWVFVHAWCMCLACVHVCVCLCVYVCVNMCMHVPSCSQICACSSQDCCVPGCDTWQPFRDDATSDNARSIREAAMDSARTEPWSQKQSNIKVKCSTWSEQWLIFFLNDTIYLKCRTTHL